MRSIKRWIKQRHCKHYYQTLNWFGRSGYPIIVNGEKAIFGFDVHKDECLRCRRKEKIILSYAYVGGTNDTTVVMKHSSVVSVKD